MKGFMQLLKKKKELIPLIGFMAFAPLPEPPLPPSISSSPKPTSSSIKAVILSPGNKWTQPSHKSCSPYTSSGSPSRSCRPSRNCRSEASCSTAPPSVQQNPPALLHCAPISPTESSSPAP
ncbi:hypothetical protein NQD34_001419 [Periophthalmus magnuspinnatus]|nr:hypothetical protein NQD34_001419 [Periophthalmus magnuspinnatus]